MTKRPIDIVQVKKEIEDGKLVLHKRPDGSITLSDLTSQETVNLGWITPTVIDKFDGAYDFLSNFYDQTPVCYRGICFGSSEAAYQAQKCPERAKEFEPLSAREAKKLGRKVEICPQWDEIKDAVMFRIVYGKFQNLYLRKMLLDTGDATLIEGNTWHDTYWGVCDDRGQNRLGYILMRVRELYRFPDKKVTAFDEQLSHSISKYAVYLSDVLGEDMQ